jgi:predicted nucleic acid-binding protein
VTPLFVDTGFLIAVEMVADQHHAAATASWRQIVRDPPELVTTSFVLSELITFFTSRGRHGKAVDVAENLKTSPSVRLVYVDEALFEAGFEYLKRRPDKRFSLTDCISFVVMNRLGIHQALIPLFQFDCAFFDRQNRNGSHRGHRGHGGTAVLSSVTSVDSVRDCSWKTLAENAQSISGIGISA